MVAAAPRAVDERFEDQAAQSLAAPAVLTVRGALRGARIRRLRAIRRERTEGNDLVADGRHERRIRGVVSGEPRALSLRAAGFGVGRGRGAGRLEVPDGSDLSV